MSLICARIPGNKYWNGVLFGSGELAGMIFTQYLLTNFDDMTCFYVVWVLGQLSYMVFTFFPTVGLHTYLATFTVIVSVGGWFNTILLILELRVPPNKVGLTSVIARTFAVGCAIVAPTVATMPEPYPYVFCSCLSAVALLSSFFLPPPGLYLPTAVKTGENSIQLVDR